MRESKDQEHLKTGMLLTTLSFMFFKLLPGESQGKKYSGHLLKNSKPVALKLLSK